MTKLPTKAPKFHAQKATEQAQGGRSFAGRGQKQEAGRRLVPPELEPCVWGHAWGRVWGHVWAWGRAWGRANVCCLHVSARGREAVSPGGGDVKEWGSWQTGTPRSQAYVTILTLFCWLSFPHRVHPALQIVTLTSL